MVDRATTMNHGRFPGAASAFHSHASTRRMGIGQFPNTLHQHQDGYNVLIGEQLYAGTNVSAIRQSPVHCGGLGTPFPRGQTQLAASMQLQKLNTQYYGQQQHVHAHSHHRYYARELHAAAQQLNGGVQTQAVQHLPGNVIDADLIDEDVLMALVIDMGLDRIQELPELWLGQNEFDFMTDLVSKQQPSQVSC